MYFFPNLESVCCPVFGSNCCFLTCICVSYIWVLYFHLFKNFPQFVVIHTVKGFYVVNKAEVDIFLEFSCFFYDPVDFSSWSLVPVPFLNPAWTPGNSLVMHCWSLAWRILSITCWCVGWVQLCSSLSILWHCLSLGLNENWPFLVLWPLLSFPNLLAYWV